MAIHDNASKTYLAISTEAVQQSVQLLQSLLADSLFMYQLYKKYHWHVTGSDFYQYHLLFDKHAEEQLPIIDLIAERLRTLGSVAPGMPQDVIENASLSEPGLDSDSPLSKVKNLLETHEAYMTTLRQAISVCNDNDDEGTSDLLVSDVLRVHELQVWFLRSSLANQ